MILFDFEDVAWGHPVQDVAITLYYEQRDPRYADLRAAFRDGYETVARWPERDAGEIDHFIAARTLMFVNFVLNIAGDPEEFYSAAFPRLERFVEAWS